MANNVGLKERISLKKCREILKGKDELTDEQIIAIRDFLYELAQIDYDIYMHNQSKVTLTDDDQNENIKNAA